jgi:hypothetical protein
MDANNVSTMAANNAVQISPLSAGQEVLPVSALSGTTAGFVLTPFSATFNIWGPNANQAPANPTFQILTPEIWSTMQVQNSDAQLAPDVAEVSPMGDIRGKSVPAWQPYADCWPKGYANDTNVEYGAMLPAVRADQLRQMENLANIQSSPREPLDPDISTALMLGATRIGLTRYVAIGNCSYGELEEEVQLTTPLGCLKIASLPDRHCVQSNNVSGPTARQRR